MARTTNEFGGGEIVPAIEAITGIQAPVMADFVQYPNITVENDHGVSRRQQNLVNNLKSSSGIERIPFNGIDELDTEQGPNGEPVFALNTGDSRIRFYGPEVSVVSNINGTSVQTASSTIDGFLEFTFFGTGLNLLIDTGQNFDPNPSTFAEIVVDGVTRAATDIPNFTDRGLLGVRNRKSNPVFPIVSGLSAGVHTVTITISDTCSLYGCEFINENAAITQQPGADFDGRVELLNAQTFPIKPTNTPITSRNDSSGVDAAFTGTTGARVLNYLTSGGQQKQIYEPAVETLNGAGSNLHTITFSAAGAGAVTLPADVTSWSILTFGAGGGGGGAAFAQSINFSSQLATASAGGGAGAGGGRSFSNFTKTGGTTTAIVTTVGAGTSGAGVVASNFGDQTATATAGGDGGTTSVTVDGTELISATGGGGGSGGSAASRINDNVFTQATPGVNETTQRGQGTGADGAKGSTNITATDTLNSGDTNAGDDARNGSGTVGARTEQAGFTPNEAGGTGGNGAQPGGSAGGNGATSNSGLTGQNGGATVGSIVLVFQSASGTALSVTNGTDVVVLGGAEEFSPFFAFGTTDHSRQEVIRRINFREFGANSAFATLGTSDANNAFTLDDGTTTLVARDAASVTANGLTGLSADTNGAITITFVGTGLDVVNNRTGPLGAHTVSVDGLSIGTLPTTQPIGVIPIVSGLSYGTHTVSFLPTGAPRISIVDFIIYGPKKPEIPTLDAGSLELSDYNIMADYVATARTGTGDSNGVGGFLSLGKGLLRKMSTQEFRYQGAYQSLTSFSSSSINGTQLETLNANNNHFYTFYGTGFDYRFGSVTGKTVTFFIDQANTGEITPIALDGTEVIGGNTISVDFYGTGTTVATVENFTARAMNATGTGEVTFAAKTNGQLGTNSGTQNNAGIVIRNLPLGLHTVRVFVGGAGSSKYTPRCFDVITPIHINDDTLKVGSEGLNNLTIDPVVEEDEAVVLANLGEAKAWFNYDIATNTVDSSFNISAIIETSGGQRVIVFFDKPFKDNSYICCPAIEPSGNTSGATIQIDRQPAEAGTRDSKTASGCTLLSNSLGTFTCSFFGELIDE